MPSLYEALSTKVTQWRADGFPSSEFPAVAEILRYATEPGGELKYLRSAQLHALEAYWYLRAVAGTPSIPALYEALFPKLNQRLQALGVSPELFASLGYDSVELFDRVASDESFVRANHLESLRETLALKYPSYILALAMGAGKTILIAAIIATEFAMAQEYPEASFVQNALVFAPGKTIIQSLREISEVPYDRILPSRFYASFASSMSIVFTRDGDKDIPIVQGSRWNIVVTNTEKIRITKAARRAPGVRSFFAAEKASDHAEEIANLRLQSIASLPNLAVFSDEAHHTYGQKLLGEWRVDQATGLQTFRSQGIKKVRQTVDYLAEETNVLLVVNTTGTPYFERRPLLDVVTWYGLGQGIRDGILKEVADNIRVLDIDEARNGAAVSDIVADFIAEYWTTSLPDGSPAKLAMYFPTIDARDEARGFIERTLASAGFGKSADVR